MKIISVFTVNSVNLTGTKLGEAVSLNISKYPGITMTFHAHGVLVGLNSKFTIVPFSNIKNIIVEDEHGSKRAA